MISGLGGAKERMKIGKGSGVRGNEIMLGENALKEKDMSRGKTKREATSQ